MLLTFITFYKLFCELLICSDFQLQLDERKARKIWFTFNEFGGEEQRCLDHTGCCLHILALRATRVRSVGCWGHWSAL